MAVINGTDLGETIRGTADADTIYGLGGDDTLLGGAGYDKLYGGDGNDVIDGGGDIDQLWGDAGDDTLSGGYLYYGGEGNDTIYTGDRTGFAYGGAGNDRLIGGRNDSDLHGGDGDDYIDTGDDASNNDAGYGDAGNDFLRGRLLSGGDGNDVLVGVAPPPSSRGFSPVFLSGNDGDDTMSAVFSVAGNVRLGLGGGSGVTEAGNDTIRADVTAQATWAEVDIVAGTGDDIVDAKAAANTRIAFDVDGGAGDDIIAATARTIDASGSTADNQLKIHAGAGADHIAGNAYGQSGRVINTVYGEDGADSIALTTMMNGPNGGLARSIASGGIGDDQITVNAFADGVASTGRLVSTLYGNSGNDTLKAVSSAGTAAVSDQRQDLYGGSGNDHLMAEASLLSVKAGKVVNNLDGAEGADRLIATIDTVEGNNVTNLLDGGADDDILTATLHFSGVGSGTALGQNKLFGGDGNDTLLATVEDGTGKSSLFGGDGNDTLTVVGGANNDLQGGAGADTLTGGDGVDGLRGGDDADVLFGGGGTDTLRGEAGNDRLDGGTGNDLLYGGAGADTFAFSAGSGRDKILDFEAGDRLDLSSFGFASYGEARGHFSTSAGDAVFQIGADSLRLSGFDLALLNENNFFL